MRAKEYQLIDQCVETGVRYGYHRAYKHTDTPTEEQMVQTIQNAVMAEICEWFDFDRGDRNEVEDRG